MPAPTVNILSPSSNGQSIAIPYIASGGYSSLGNPTLFYQINGGPLKTISNFGGGNWSLNLTTSDCPNVGSYILTVYIVDPANSPMMNSAYRQFNRSS